MVLDMFTDEVFASGRNVAAQSSEANALSSTLLQSIQDAAHAVVPADDGCTGLCAIGKKVGDALIAFGMNEVQPMLVQLNQDIIDLGDGTSGSAVVVDEADIAAYEENVAAMTTGLPGQPPFSWEEPGSPGTPYTPD